MAFERRPEDGGKPANPTKVSPSPKPSSAVDLGPICTPWKQTTLAEAGVSLIDCDHRTPTAATTGYPYIAIPQLKNGHINFAGARRISKEHYIEWTKKLKPQEHDVIVVRRCNSGDSAVVPHGIECAIGQNLVILRADGSGVLPPFLRWLVRGPDWWGQVEKFINVGAVFDSLRCRDIPHFDLTIPPLAEQRSIADTLGALDDRIELLRQTNVTLEAIARALFKSWFIDFDPVRAKAEGREPDGMDAATTALFPDSFEDSSLGPIPQGWHASSLSDCVELNPQRVLRKGSLASYLDMANAPTQGHRPAEITQREFGSGSKFINGDTLLAKITPCLENGKTAFVDFLADNEVGWGSTEFIVMRPRAPLPPFWGYLLARMPNFRAFAIQAMTGTSGRQRVDLGSLKQFSVVVPDDGVAEAFGGIIEPLRARIAAASSHADNLTQLRDTLLPRLISGKLRLPEAQVLIEDATP